MLECEECKHVIGIEDSNINSFYIGCKQLCSDAFLDGHKTMMGIPTMIGGFELMYDDVQSCLFFKAHCGKCRGNCGNH